MAMLLGVHFCFMQVSVIVSSIIVAASLDIARGVEMARDRDLGATNLRSQTRIASTFTIDPNVNHTLIVCNAYANAASLSVSQIRANTMIADKTALRYKACVTTEVALKNGDQLDFSTQHHTVGSFFATGLSNEPTTLVVVPHRRDASSMAATFKSHAFSSSVKTHMVIIDAYVGKLGGSVQIMDVTSDNLGEHHEPGSAPAERIEDLAYNQVVALSPGAYHLGMVTNKTQVVESKGAGIVSLDVSGREQVVVLRVGGPSNEGDKEKYAPELLVYSHKNGAASVLSHGVCIGFLFVSAVLHMLSDF
jgi:hypothetical protein